LNTTENILSVRGLSKKFGGLVALDELDIDVKRESIHGLMGPNGAGKTTFFNVITRLLPLTSGTVLFESDDITTIKPHLVPYRGISRTFQAGKLAPGMTVLENIMTGAYCKTDMDVVGTFFKPPFTTSAQERKIRELAMELLELIGMTEFADRWAGDLVWVERQMVQIARALASSPKLLLLDEPTGGMGADESLRVAELIQKVRDEKGVTIVVVGHDMKLVMGISEWITCINFGKKICEGPPGDVRCDPGVLEAYLGKEQNSGFDG
jgi:ABC-type branched-subunit amino acid transport system ATPase component